MASQPSPDAAAAAPPLERAFRVPDVVKQARAGLRARHQAGATGGEIVRAYTAFMDRLLATLFAIATHEYFARNPRIRHRCAIVAQGGYGRRELSPCSDVDIVFLYPWKANAFVETLAEKVLYPLWDTGLAVGHSLRNPRGCVRLAAQDLTVKTALLDARFICGDVSVFGELERAIRAELLSGRDGARFVREKLKEQAERHHRCGDSIYLLQPHVKEGAGGLRDIHTALWLAKVKFKVRRFRDLVTLGIITEGEVAELEASQDFLWRVRNALHFLTGTHEDQLRFEYQDRIAVEIAGHDGPPEETVEHFMRLYYLHAAAVGRLSEAVVARCVERVRSPGAGTAPVRAVRDGMQVRGNVLSVTGPRVFRQSPSNLIRVFAEAQRQAAVLSRLTKRHIREHLHLIDERVRRDPEAVEAFLDVLRGPHRVYEALDEMHRHGVLVHFIPEFASLFCLGRRDPYHVYTVDEHSLRGILELERLRAGAYAPSCPLLTQVMREDDKVEILLLAMLFHDIGKGKGRGHSEEGARLVAGIAERLGLNTDDAAQLTLLVRNHLLMSNLAQRRDVHDDGMVLSFAKQLGDVSTLRKLYLLTFADMKAVGPGYWNNWRDHLLGELYVRTGQMLERDVSIEEHRKARLQRVKARVRKAMGRAAVGRTVDAADVEAFLASMPESYFLASREDGIPAHVALVARFRSRLAENGAVVETMVRHFPEWDYSEFTVCTKDRPGLFSTFAGVLAAAGLNVASARIATGADGTVLDEFRISHAERRELVLEERLWSRVRETLEGALRGEVDVEALVRRSRRPTLLGKRRKGFQEPKTGVAVDNTVSAAYTVLDVYAADRIGLLFTITRCLYHLGLQTHLAKITTTIDQVLDVFYVTDEEGRKVEEAGRLDAITAELTKRLLEDAAAATAAEATASA
jgi:[protein-PII] uridylyltransferase